MARQEEVGDAVLDGVLVAAVTAHELAFHHLGLHEQLVQLLEELFVRLEVLWRGGLLGEGGEAELVVEISMSSSLRVKAGSGDVGRPE